MRAAQLTYSSPRTPDRPAKRGRLLRRARRRLVRRAVRALLPVGDAWVVRVGNAWHRLLATLRRRIGGGGPHVAAAAASALGCTGSLLGVGVRTVAPHAAALRAAAPALREVALRRRLLGARVRVRVRVRVRARVRVRGRGGVRVRRCALSFLASASASSWYKVPSRSLVRTW